MSLGNVIQRTGVDRMCTAFVEVIVTVVSLISFFTDKSTKESQEDALISCLKCKQIKIRIA